MLTGLEESQHVRYLACQLYGLGLRIQQFYLVSNSTIDLEHTLERCLREFDWIVISGGLGATENDITCTVIAKLLRKNLVVLSENLEKITDKVKHSPQLKTSDSFRRQAETIDGAEIWDNSVGIVPAQYIKYGLVKIALLPDEIQEFQVLIDKFLIPELQKERRRSVLYRILRTCGINEVKIQDYLKVLKMEHTRICLSSSPNQVDIQIEVDAQITNSEKLLKEIEKHIRDYLEDYIFGYDHEELEYVVSNLLKKQKATLSIVESCTGGLIAKKITDISGSSKFFKMGWILYSNESKQEMLGIPEDILHQYGAVSSEVAMRMADLARKRAKTDFAIATTGIAGPSGGTELKPVGLVYIAVALRNEVKVQKFQFSGSRELVREKASIQALDMLRRVLLHK